MNTFFLFPHLSQRLYEEFLPTDAIYHVDAAGKKFENTPEYFAWGVATNVFHGTVICQVTVDLVRARIYRVEIESFSNSSINPVYRGAANGLAGRAAALGMAKMADLPTDSDPQSALLPFFEGFFQSCGLDPLESVVPASELADRYSEWIATVAAQILRGLTVTESYSPGRPWIDPGYTIAHRAIGEPWRNLVADRLRSTSAGLTLIGA